MRGYLRRIGQAAKETWPQGRNRSWDHNEVEAGDVFGNFLSSVYCGPRTRTGSVGGNLGAGRSVRKWWIVWPLYAGVMGFALGESFFFGLYGRNVTESSIAAQHEQQPPSETAKSKKDETDEALAYYTLWLMAFTGVLAFATVGLGIATMFLYVTGEKQFKFAIRSSVRQSRQMQASVAAAAEANRISSEGFHASQRAWVTEETVTDSNLVWNKQGCELVIKTKVKNIGIAPAQEVVIDAKIVATTRQRPEYNISDAMNELPSGTMGHLLFRSADFAPSKKLKLTREQIDKVSTGGKEVTINVIVIVRYLSTMDRKGARTIRFYDLKRLPVVGEEISYPLPINIDEDVPQGMLLQTHHWMPSYAD